MTPSADASSAAKSRSGRRSFLPVVLLVVAVSGTWQLLTRENTSGSTVNTRDPIPLAGLHLSGSTDAPVGLIVFSDFQCPACGTLALGTIPQIRSDYVDTGRVLLAMSDLPLEPIHPFAVRRAMVAECAARQGQFWKVHDALFELQRSPRAEEEGATGLDAVELERCLTSDAEHAVRRRAQLAGSLGVRSTPTIAIGTLAAGALHVSEIVVGVQSPDALAARLDRVLRRQGS